MITDPTLRDASIQSISAMRRVGSGHVRMILCQQIKYGSGSDQPTDACLCTCAIQHNGSKQLH